ncbi:MAG: FMN-binding negative transcriptional regulator [Alphaproteobacteria bacterium]|nr:FMN-binding negative transcriptional regulator [Alphaproteobacteria bacterium]
MYIPSDFAWTDQEALHDLIDDHSFGVLTTTLADGTLEAAHIPFVLDRAPGPHGTLHAHVARANPIWQAFDGKREVLAVFQGPHSYVSPRWYSNPRSVPTWNFAAVHAYGVPALVDDRAAQDLLARLSAKHEAGNEKPWHPDQVDAKYLDGMRKHIVAFAIPIARLLGKHKMSQNRPEEDRVNVRLQLKAEGHADGVAVAAMMDRMAGA